MSLKYILFLLHCVLCYGCQVTLLPPGLSQFLHKSLWLLLSQDLGIEVSFSEPQFQLEQHSVKILRALRSAHSCSLHKTSFCIKPHRDLTTFEVWTCSESQKIINEICHRCKLENQMDFCLFTIM